MSPMSERRSDLAALALRQLPTSRLMDLEPARYDAGALRLCVSAHLGAEFSDRRGFIRGGFLAALLDDVMTGAVIMALGRDSDPVLVSQSLDYLGSASPGHFTAEGWVLSLGAQHCVAKGLAQAANGTTIALSQAVIVRGPELL